MGFGAVGVKDFLGLKDTPSSYVGKAGGVPIVEATEDGLRLGALDYTKILADWEHRFYWSEGQDLEEWLEAIDGSGTTQWTNHRLVVLAGAVANSHANRMSEIPYGEGASLHKINWDYPVWCQIEGKFYTGGSAVNHRYAFLGIDSGLNLADGIVGVGMGIRFDRAGVLYYAQCRNGNGLTNELVTGIQVGGRTILRMVFTPGVSIKFYAWNGSAFELKGTLTTNIPSGDGTGKIQVAANNGTSTDDMRAELTRALLYHHY